MKRAALPLLALLAINPVQAAEPSTYSPEYCNFQITFPEEPHKARRCEDNSEDRCYDLISYTQTYEVHASVNFRVICNPIEPGVREKYTESVAKASVRAMAEKSGLKDYRTSFRKEAVYSQAGLVGEGVSGAQPKIYISQLWVGETSVMSVEGELVGAALEDADRLFAEVMRSVRLKQKSEKEEEPKPDDKNSDPRSPITGRR